jgi:aspartyl-tRNA(Asn)/glutamyl-tRNA(Gln) amidotransferase subunit A
MTNLLSLSAVEMRDGLVSRDFSARELAEAHLLRIEETNSKVNSFITVSRERALHDADRADKILAEHGPSSPRMTGIPIAVKDMICTTGIATTCASKILKDFVPPYDSTAVSRLKADGAVIVGKTNMDEFAMGSSTEHSAFGPTRNPWDLERVPGGSSGGSAVAVSLGQAPLALGTDTGGSIRQPASFCGVVGLKPTYGRVSRYGVVAYASSLDQLGPFARNSLDVAMILESIAGYDEHDSTSMKVDVPNYVSTLRAEQGLGLKGVRVGVPKEYFIPGMDAAVEKSAREALKTFEQLGAELVPISLPHTEFALSVYYIIAPAEASSNLARYDGVRYGLRAQGAANLNEMYQQTRAAGFGAEVKRRILIGSYVLSTGYYDQYYNKAQCVRTLIVNDFKSAFANSCDVIAAPVSPTTAFKLGENEDSPLKMYLADIFTITANLAGLPGIAFPCGVDAAGLPIGLQLLGSPFSEPLLLRVARAFELEKKFDNQQMTRRAL